jgi:hypothetical protein
MSQEALHAAVHSSSKGRPELTDEVFAKGLADPGEALATDVVVVHSGQGSPFTQPSSNENTTRHDTRHTTHVSQARAHGGVWCCKTNERVSLPSRSLLPVVGRAQELDRALHVQIG